MEIEYQGQFDKAAFFRAVFMVKRPTRFWEIGRVLLAVASVVALVAYLVLVLSKLGQEEIDWFRAGRAFVAFPVLAYFSLQPYITAYTSATSMWRESSSRATLSGSVNGIGIDYRVGVAQRLFAWDAFVRLRRTNDLLVLVTADGRMVALKREFFATNADWVRFQELAAARVREVK